MAVSEKVFPREENSCCATPAVKPELEITETYSVDGKITLFAAEHP